MKNSLHLLICLCAFISSLAHADWLPQSVAPYEIVNSHVDVEVDEKGLSTEVREVELRAINEQGRTALVMQTVPYIPDAEVVKVVRASSITDGVETLVDLNTISERTGKAPTQGVAHGKEFVISFPNVKIGSVVKYSVSRKQTRNLVPGYFSMVFVFGHGTPELAGSARIRSKIPLFTSQLDLWATAKVDFKQDNGYSVIEIKQLRPIFKFPGEVNPVFDIQSIAKIEITSLRQWKEYAGPIAEKYEAILAEKLPTQFDAIAKKAAKGKTLEEKIDIVTSELATVMTYAGDWTSYEKMFFPKSLKEIGAKKIGDCKDFSLATTAMLRSIGIQAAPAFTVRKVSSGQLGIISYHSLGNTVIDDFNHAIVKVKAGDRDLWVDPTNMVSDAAYTFSDIAGSKAIEISKTATKLETIPYPEMEKSRVFFTRDIKIKEDQSAESVTSFEVSGEFSKYVLETALQKTAADGQKVLNAFLRTLDKSAKTYYESVDLSSRKSRRIAGTQKIFGEKIFEEEKGKSYITIPLPVTLYGYAQLQKPRVTTANMVSRFTETSITKVEGFDFVGMPSGCTIWTPWFDVQRKIFKNEKGFEVHDKIDVKEIVIRSSDINSDKFQAHVGHVIGCAREQNIEVRALDPKETLVTRLRDYTPKKAKEFLYTTGPGSVTAHEKMNHLAQQILFKDPKNKDALLARALSYRFLSYIHAGVDRSEYQRKYDEFVKEAESLYPNDTEVQMVRARYLIREEKYQEAVGVFAKFFKPDMKSFEAYLIGAWITKGLKNTTAAAGAYQKALLYAQSKAEKAIAYNGLGDIYEELKDTDKAISFFKQSLAENPENTWLHGEVVDMLTKLNRWDEAIVEGEKMLKVADFGVGRQQLARAYGAKADSIYSQAKAKDPTLSHESSKKYLEEVESNHLKALRHAPGYSTSLMALGSFYRDEAMRTGDTLIARKGLGVLEKAEKSDDPQYISLQKLNFYKKELQDLVDGRVGSARIPAASTQPSK